MSGAPKTSRWVQMIEGVWRAVSIAALILLTVGGLYVSQEDGVPFRWEVIAGEVLLVLLISSVWMTGKRIVAPGHGSWARRIEFGLLGAGVIMALLFAGTVLLQTLAWELAVVAAAVCFAPWLVALSVRGATAWMRQREIRLGRGLSGWLRLWIALSAGWIVAVLALADWDCALSYSDRFCGRFADWPALVAKALVVPAAMFLVFRVSRWIGAGFQGGSR